MHVFCDPGDAEDTGVDAAAAAAASAGGRSSSSLQLIKADRSSHQKKSPDIDCICAGGGTGNLYVSCSALE